MNPPPQVKLRDCVRLAKGKPPAQQPYYGVGSAWYLTPEYLRGAASCESAKPSANAVHVQDGETILLWDGSNAGEVFLGRDGMLASTMTLVSPDNRFTPEYFFFALKQWEPYLKGQTFGSGIPHVDMEVLGKLEITEFEELDQIKIAEVLSTVDRAITQTEALIAKQQRIKTSLMQDLLTRGIDEQGQLRSEATHAFKDSPLRRIPVEWECEKLSVFVPSAEYGISSSLGADGYPVLRMNNLLDGEAEISDLKHTDVAVPEHLWLRNGDVLFNRTNSWEHVGRTGIWRDQIEKVTFASYLVRLNPDPKRLLPDLLNIWLNWEPTQIAMRRQATPAVQQVNINPTNLRSILAAFPVDLHEQQMIVDRIAGLKATLADYKANREKLRRLKAALMLDLLSGKVRVTPLLQQAEEAVTP